MTPANRTAAVRDARERRSLARRWRAVRSGRLASVNRAARGAAALAFRIGRRWRRGLNDSVRALLPLDVRGRPRRFEAFGRWSVSVVLHHTPRGSAPRPLMAAAAAAVAAVRRPGAPPATAPGRAIAVGTVARPPVHIERASAVRPAWSTPPRHPAFHVPGPWPGPAASRGPANVIRGLMVPPGDAATMPRAAALVKGPVWSRDGRRRGAAGSARQPEAATGLAPTGRPWRGVLPRLTNPLDEAIVTRRLAGAKPVRPARADGALAAGGAEHAPAWMSVVADGNASRARRWARVDQPVPRVALDARRPVVATPYEPDGRVAATLTTLPAARVAGPRRSPEVNFAEVEQAIAAKVERRIGQKVSTTIEDAVAPGAELYRQLTDRVYDSLYERLVLEKERLG